ncbi:MAG: Ig-like domain-containing protein [Lachnospiraceae bacterium]|nr:Ig-like domain-containing protein [Lachnospiraceae bacterium]
MTWQKKSRNGARIYKSFLRKGEYMKRISKLIKSIGLVLALSVFAVLLGFTRTYAADVSKIDLKEAKDYKDLENLLDDEVFLTTEGNGTVQKQSKVFSLDVKENGWIAVKAYVNEYFDWDGKIKKVLTNWRPDYKDFFDGIDIYLYSNKALTNSAPRLLQREAIESSKFSNVEYYRFYVTPGTYYLEVSGDVQEDDYSVCSIAFLPSKILIDVDEISYSDDYKTATVTFKFPCVTATELQLLSKEYEYEEGFFNTGSLNQLKYYNTLSGDNKDESASKIDEILADGVEIKKNGTYSLLIKAADDNYADYPVSVTFTIDRLGSKEQNIEAKTVKLSKTKATLKVGKKVTLTATIKPADTTNKTITWKSSNKKVATVDKNGNVTAKKKGVCVITAVTSNGKKAKCKITVKK